MTKRALVTGCSSGIGLAVTRALLADGWDVLGVSRSWTDAKHERFRHIRCDLSAWDEIEPALLALEGHPLDALVHCAAMHGPNGPFWSQQRAWDETIQTNLMGTVHALRASWQALHRSNDARVLLFSGGGAFGPRPGYSAYATSKAGVVSLMETLAADLAGTNVAVNCVSPGYVPTPIHGYGFSRETTGPEIETVVACVRHLLSAAVRGLTGKTISAPFDDWASISPLTVPGLMESAMGTRDRHKIQCVAQFARRTMMSVG